jgi:RNA polymerase sigma-70 factor (ECF subfamily)
MMDINTLHKEAVSGEKNAESSLFELLTVRLRYLATLRLRSVEDAEEVVQEALMAISREYAEISIETSFAAWAHKVLINRILNHVKTKKLRDGRIEKKFNPENMPEGGIHESNPDLKRRLLECLRKISDLNPRYARILNFQYQGYKTEEICRRISVNSNNLYVILSRARSLLQHCLKTGGIEQ